MKIKPEKNGKVLMELGEHDSDRLVEAAIAAAPVHIKNLLVPVDFSPCSEKSLAYAIPFARQFGATITLLHVLEIPPVVGAEFTQIDYAAIEARAKDDGTAELKQLAAAQAADGVTMRTHLASGRSWSEIVDFAKREKSDMIIIATHGHTGLKHVLLGSITEQVVRHAPCPVLVVREREHEFV